MTTRPRITTFYSYKGGVGRTSALANLAVLAARSHRRVLAMDFDLEAPGLHHYFPPRQEVPREGVIDLFLQLRQQLEEAFQTEGSFDPKDPAVLARCRALLVALLDRPGLFIEGPVANLWLLYAGRFDDSYADRVQAFDWNAFFATFGELFSLLREELHRRFDEVFIDARTGLTDISNLSTVVFPDRLVVVFAPNEQAFHGGLEVAWQAYQQHAARMEEKNAQDVLDVVPLLCRLDPSESKLRSDFINQAAARFSALYAQLQGQEGLNLVRYFSDLNIPYQSRYSYGEEVAVLAPDDQGRGTMAAAFEAVHQHLLTGRMVDWKVEVPVVALRDDRALIVQFDAECRLPPGLRFAQEVRLPLAPWTRLRQEAGRAETWPPVQALLTGAITRVTKDLRGGLFVFAMLPYTAALLLGRQLDAQARGAAVHLHHFQDGQWRLFSSPEVAAQKGAPPVFDVKWHPAPQQTQGSAVLLALEGSRAIAPAILDELAVQCGAGHVLHISQLSPDYLKPPLETAQAVREVRLALANLKVFTGSTIHLVTTAPAALLIEVGRMLSPTVYRSVIMHEYNAANGSYVQTVDVITLSRQAAQ